MFGNCDTRDRCHYSYKFRVDERLISMNDFWEVRHLTCDRYEYNCKVRVYFFNASYFQVDTKCLGYRVAATLYNQNIFTLDIIITCMSPPQYEYMRKILHPFLNVPLLFRWRHLHPMKKIDRIRSNFAYKNRRGGTWGEKLNASRIP